MFNIPCEGRCDKCQVKKKQVNTVISDFGDLQNTQLPTTYNTASSMCEGLEFDR
jgi:hypothetical protein